MTATVPWVLPQVPEQLISKSRDNVRRRGAVAHTLPDQAGRREAAGD